MEMLPIHSTNLAAIGYDNETETLQIEFISGGMYQYFDVPLNQFEALRDAESAGRYLAMHIKGHFRYSRV